MRANVRIVPITLRRANDYIREHHRHHGPLPNGMAWWCVGAVVDGRLVGVAIAGRPSNRNNDDGQTVEVHRVATDGTANACSALYGACARAARSIGAYRIITYTLVSESGSSLRGAGWTRESDGITSSWAIGAEKHTDTPDGLLPENGPPVAALCDECGAVPGRWHYIGCSRRRRKIVVRPHLGEPKVRWSVRFGDPVPVQDERLHGAKTPRADEAPDSLLFDTEIGST